MSAAELSRFDELVSRYLDDELIRADASELVTFLAEPELAARFLEMMRLNSEIGGLLSAPVPDAAMVELVRADIEKSLAAAQPTSGVRLRIAERPAPASSTTAAVPVAHPLPQKRGRALWRLAWAAVFVVFAGLATTLVVNRTPSADAPIVVSARGEVRLEGPSCEHLL